MKNKNKAFQLIEKGLSVNTVAKLTEQQISILHKKMIGEAQVVSTQYVDLTADEVKGGAKVPDTVLAGKKNVTISPNPKSPGGVRIEPTAESELGETETDDVTDQNAFSKDALQDYTGQEAPHDANDMGCDGMDDDSCNDRKMMGMSEAKKNKSKAKNPWAICTAQLGSEFGTRERHLWNAKEKNKYERCVKDVKKSLKEGKNPISLFLENEIYRIVEKHLPPKITKADLMKYLTENNPATAPTKPKERPGTTEKPGKPKERPMRPGKNPHPGEKEAPKAISPEDAKNKLIKSIISLFRHGKS